MSYKSRLTLCYSIVVILYVYTMYNSLHVRNYLNSTMFKISSKIIQKMPLENTSSSLVAHNVPEGRKRLVSSIYKHVYLNNNTKLCKNGGNLLKVLIIIHSEPSNKQQRSIIRQTWGSYANRSDIDIGFILGQSPDENVENSLTEENNLFDDLIRGQFIDNYNNLTLKSISMLEWVDKKCPHAKLILKTDDDIFINIPILLQFINEYQKYKNVIFGHLARNWGPVSNKDSKYYVSVEEFSSDIYPEFTTGAAYLISSDIIHNLYMKSLKNIYLKLEDVFITGIVAHQLNIKRLDVFGFLNRPYKYNSCLTRAAIAILLPKFDEQFAAWKDSLNTTIDCKKLIKSVYLNILSD